DGDATLAEAVHAGRIKDPPPGTDVPPRIRRAVVRGLAVDPAERWPSLEMLLAELEVAPAATGRRALAIAVVVALIGGALAGGWVLRAHRAAAPRCDGGAARLTGVWDRTRQNQVSDAFHRVDRPFSSNASTAVSIQLD